MILSIVILRGVLLIKLKLADGVVAPPFNEQNPEGSDWDDYAIIFGAGKAREALLEGEDTEKLCNISDFSGFITFEKRV